MNTTIDHPMPISRRFAPVMFARASEHGDSVPPEMGGHEAPNSSKEFPACQAKTKSTAYSGSTAIRARTAIARPAEISSWATSAAQERMNADPTIARPNTAAPTGFGTEESSTRNTSAGTVTATAMASEIRCRAGWVSARSSRSVVTVVVALLGSRSRPRRRRGERRVATRDRVDGGPLSDYSPAGRARLAARFRSRWGSAARSPWTGHRPARCRRRSRPSWSPSRRRPTRRPPSRSSRAAPRSRPPSGSRVTR